LRRVVAHVGQADAGRTGRNARTVDGRKGPRRRDGRARVAHAVAVRVARGGARGALAAVAALAHGCHILIITPRHRTRRAVSGRPVRRATLRVGRARVAGPGERDARRRQRGDVGGEADDRRGGDTKRVLAHVADLARPVHLRGARLRADGRVARLSGGARDEEREDLEIHF